MLRLYSQKRQSSQGWRFLEIIYYLQLFVIMKKYKKLLITAIIYPLILLTVSLIISRNLFIDEWKEVILCFILYVGIAFFVLRNREKATRE